MEEFARFYIRADWCNDQTADLDIWCKECPGVTEVASWNDQSVSYSEITEKMREHNASRHA